MKARTRTLVGVLSATVLLVSGAVRAQASAPQMVQKVLAENERVKVVENVFSPGAESPSVARPFRVVRALTGGKVERIFPEGKIENGEYTTGQVGVFEASPPYILKNSGDSELVLYIVYIKK